MKNQESLERIVETKFHDLDVKVTEMATDLGKLKEDFEAQINSDSDEQTTTQYQAQPRPAPTVAPASVVPPPVSTPLAPADFVRGICRCSHLHSIDPHRSYQPEDFFITCSCGSSPE